MDNLPKNGAFSSDPSEEKQPASALLWVFYYAAQHFDHKGETDKALFYIDAAIEHTPTLIELFIVKGRIFKVCYSEISEPIVPLFLSRNVELFWCACNLSMPAGIGPPPVEL